MNIFKDISFDKLILIDLVCHGTPAYKAWNSYCASINKIGFNLSKVNMRDKSDGWNNYDWVLTDDEGKRRLESHNINIYMKGYILNLYPRPACSSCRFKGVIRKTDISLRDY